MTKKQVKNLTRALRKAEKRETMAAEGLANDRKIAAQAQRDAWVERAVEQDPWKELPTEAWATAIGPLEENLFKTFEKRAEHGQPSKAFRQVSFTNPDLVFNSLGEERVPGPFIVRSPKFCSQWTMAQFYRGISTQNLASFTLQSCGSEEGMTLSRLMAWARQNNIRVVRGNRSTPAGLRRLAQETYDAAGGPEGLLSIAMDSDDSGHVVCCPPRKNHKIAGLMRIVGISTPEGIASWIDVAWSMLNDGAKIDAAVRYLEAKGVPAYSVDADLWAIYQSRRTYGIVNIPRPATTSIASFVASVRCSSKRKTACFIDEQTTIDRRPVPIVVKHQPGGHRAQSNNRSIRINGNRVSVQSDVRIRRIEKSAYTSLPLSTLLAANIPPTAENIKQDEIEAKNMNSSAPQFSVTRKQTFPFFKVKANHKGRQRKGAQEVLTQYFGVTEKFTDLSERKHSGHPFLRYITNMGIADNIQRLLTIALGSGGSITDIGSKWTQTRRVIEDAIAYVEQAIRDGCLDISTSRQSAADRERRRKLEMQLSFYANHPTTRWELHDKYTAYTSTSERHEGKGDQRGKYMYTFRHDKMELIDLYRRSDEVEVPGEADIWQRALESLFNGAAEARPDRPIQQTVPARPPIVEALVAERVHVCITNAKFTHIAWRPKENAYDRTYWMENRAAMIGRGIVNFMPFDQYWDEEAAESMNQPFPDSVLMLNDCHYYLGDIDGLPMYKAVGVVGSMFSPVPGEYRLPFSEGSYIIDRGYLRMITKSSGMPYEHRLVEVSDPNALFSTGWWTHFRHVCTGNTYRQRTQWTPPLDGPFARFKGERTSLQNIWAVDVAAETSIKLQTRYAGLAHLIKAHEKGSIMDQFEKEISRYLEAYLREATLWEKIRDLKKESIGVEDDAYLKAELSPESKLRLVETWVRSQTALQTARIVREPSIFGILTLKPTEVMEVAAIKGEVSQTGWIWKTNRRREPCEGQARINGPRAPVPTQKRYIRDLEKIDGTELKLDLVSGPYKPRAERERVEARTDCVDLKPYLVVKDCDYRSLAVDSQIIHPDYREFVAAQRTYALEKAEKDRLDGILLTYKGQPFVNEAIAITTGFSAISPSGTVVNAYEFSSKAAHNALSAHYGRHLCCAARPDGEVLKEFHKFVSPEMLRLARAVQPRQEWDPLQWVKAREDWGDGKKAKYIQTMCREVEAWTEGRHVMMCNGFTTMVKKGEVYYTSQPVDTGLLGGEKARPREIKVPPASNCGHLTYVQSLLWDSIKTNLPEFSHGWGKDEYNELVRTAAQKGLSVLNLDGSAFDSTQYAELMDSVENLFLRHLFQDTEKWGEIPAHYRDECLASCSDSATRNDAWVFVECEPYAGSGAQWPRKAYEEARKAGCTGSPESWPDRYICTPLIGSTFSGHTTKTTLGNTLRSICYAFFYAHKAGLGSTFDEIRQKGVIIRASGDDVSIFGPRDTLDMIDDVITNLSLTDKKDATPRGLGQVIVEKSIGTWRDFDFCSKMVFGESDDCQVYRDYKKVLATRNFYTGSNARIRQNPSLHGAAIHQGLCSEKASRLLENIIALRVDRSVTLDQAKSLSDKARYALTSKEGYVHEKEINRYLGIDEIDFVRAAISATVVINGARRRARPSNRTRFSRLARLAARLRAIRSESDNASSIALNSRHPRADRSPSRAQPQSSDLGHLHNVDRQSVSPIVKSQRRRRRRR